MTEASKMLTEGVQAPVFCLPDKDGRPVWLESLLGRWVVLYFYPKDNTSGCTLEAVAFSSAQADFEALNAVILAVSPDSTNSHCNFAAKHNLTITLLSDPDKSVLGLYGVWQVKKLYGKEHLGVVRSTFLIDPSGKVNRIWRKVKVKDHVQDVLTTLRSAKTHEPRL